MGKRIHNFNAGPAALPLPVLEEIRFEADWWLDQKFPPGPETDFARRDFAAAVARVLDQHGVRATKYWDGTLMKVYRITYEAVTASQIPDDVPPEIRTAVDALHERRQVERSSGKM